MGNGMAGPAWCNAKGAGERTRPRLAGLSCWQDPSPVLRAKFHLRQWVCSCHCNSSRAINRHLVCATDDA